MLKQLKILIIMLFIALPITSALMSFKYGIVINGVDLSFPTNALLGFVLGVGLECIVSLFVMFVILFGSDLEIEESNNDKRSTKHP